MKHLSIKQKRTFTIIALVLLVAMLVAPGALAMDPKGAPEEVRFATFNASLNRFNAGDLINDLSTPDDVQAKAVAEIIQRTRQNGADPIEYEFRFVAPSNTGIPSGRDLDKSGTIGGPGDAFGFGFFPGQYGMAVYSMYPIDDANIRTFQNFLWKDMPGAMLPVNPDGTSYYDAGDLAIFRLSSKSHWDIPVQIGGKTVHFLTSHPTPPVFDGPEDRNGTRNNDEIRFWADYVIPSRSGYIYDDNGGQGGITPGDPFVIAGDQNSDLDPAAARPPLGQHQGHAG
jgi:hypothetical protein